MEVYCVSDAYLILENGAVFKGRSFGYEGEAIGELVFSTGVVGYMGTLTDPRHHGQIVLQTFPLIGCYGEIPEEKINKDVQVKAYIVREWCQEPSNFRSEGNLDNFLRKNGIPGLCGVDTRALTRLIRENGTMNAMISYSAEIDERQYAALKGYKVADAVAACASAAYGSADGKYANIAVPDNKDPNNRKLRVALWDFGSAATLAQALGAAGCAVKIFGYGMTAEKILANKPDGVILSDGPGDPSDNAEAIGQIKELCGSGLPILGIGLGHLLLALARGARTEKLLFGHHGSNQPVRELDTGRVFVTGQNHGYTVTPDSLPGYAEMSYVNLNDGTCEGVDHKDIPACSIQFSPSEESGMYSRFIQMMERRSANAAE